MTDNENYCFDVSGYLIVQEVLSVEEIDACVQALAQCGESDGMLDWPSPLGDPFVRLRDHPVLAEYLEELIAEEHRLVLGPLVAGEMNADGRLVGGNEPRDPSRAYYKQNDVRFCQGVFAIWVLSDVTPESGELALVPASHKSYVETPDDLSCGVDVMGVVRQPVLKAGDLLLCAEMTLHRFNSSNLLVYGYASETAKRQSEEEALEDWVRELTPVQQAVVAGYSDTSPMIISDGKTARLSETAQVFHPSILKRDLDCGIDAKEFYYWDLCGHLVLRKVMDDAWLVAANEAIDACADQIVVGGSAAKGSKVLAGTGVPSLRDLFELPKPYCDPFREMIAHPAVVHRLNWMMGSGFLCRNARAICSVKGTSGHGLHSFAEPARPKNTYVLQNGRAYCDSINVAWQLRDVCEADGGFVCIPGSHKARYPVSPEMVTCDETMGMVTHVEVEAGDVVMFMGAAQTHGAYPWKSDVERRNVLLGYSSKNIT